MNDEIRKDPVDILQAAEEIRVFTADMSFQAYMDSLVTQRAVERDFQIIGEVLNKDLETAGSITGRGFFLGQMPVRGPLTKSR